MRRLVMLDLFAGHGGASAAMVERGWKVTRVELEPGYLTRPLGAADVDDHVADVRTWRYQGPPPDLIWASPPCTEFARESMPWCRRQLAPAMDLVFAALGHIATLRPAWWAVENVRGAIPWFTPWLGPPAISASPVFVWGRLPLARLPGRARKTAITGARPDLRSHIPYEVSAAVAAAVEAIEHEGSDLSAGVEQGRKAR